MKNKILLLIPVIVIVGILSYVFTSNKTQISDKSSTVNEACIITVDGNQYDVSSFKNRHEGGDIFICGTDMSEAFHAQHQDSVLRKVERYKI